MKVGKNLASSIFSRKIFIVMIASFVAISFMVTYSSATGNPSIAISNPIDTSSITTSTSSFFNPQGAYSVYIAPKAVTGTATPSGSPLTQVRISIDGAAYANATGTGTWSYKWTLPSNGVHTVKALVKDSAGNIGIYTSVVNIIPAPLDVKVTSPGNNTIVHNPVTIQGTSSSSAGYAVTLVQVSVDSGFYRNATGTNPWSFTFPPLSSGFHNVNILVKDNAGWSAISKLRFRI